MHPFPRPPFRHQPPAMPGSSAAMDPQPDYSETSYAGSGRLAGKASIITGGDSGIGRAVALAFAREGARRKAVLVPGDIQDPAHCRALVERAAVDFGRIDVLVNNAAHQATVAELDEISDEEWEATFRTNVHAMFYLTKAALPHLREGAAIINTTSINADKPNPGLLAYATTKGAIHNFTAGLAQMLAGRGIRVNCVAPGPV